MPEADTLKSHPEFSLETIHLDNTIQTIRELIQLLDDDLASRIQRDKDPSLGYNYASNIVEMFVRQSKAEELGLLQSAVHSPYFARVDFRQDGRVSHDSFYIGRTGVTEFRSDRNVGEAYVLDWRTPVASAVFYQVKNGRAHINAPGMSYSGDVLLRRQFEIENGSIIGISDDDMTGKLLGDKFLVTKLLRGADNRLKDIIGTIQREQDSLIRRPLSEITIVQGVAGAGKTAVGLHRIAYLIYAYKLDPARIAIVAPNQLFLKYISNVLPGLNADGVWQGTFTEIAESLLGEAYEIQDNRMLASVIENHTWTDEDQSIRWVRLRGAKEFKDCIDRFLEDWEQEYANIIAVDISERITRDNGYAIQLTISGKSLSSRFLNSTEPINARIRNRNELIRKQLTEQVRRALDLFEVRRVKGGRKEEVALPISDEYRNALDKIIDQHQANVYTPITFYRMFLNSPACKDICSRYGIHRENELGVLDADDMASIVYMQILLNGIDPQMLFDHILIDEAQDCTSFELIILQILAKRRSITLMGDMNQAIYAYRSVRSWQEVQEAFYPQVSEYTEMRLSYRSAKEVVDYCNLLISDKEAIGIPVFKVDREPIVRQISTPDEGLSEMSDRILEWRKIGYKTMAVIVKKAADCPLLYEQLSRLLAGKIKVDIVSEQTTDLGDGVVVIPIMLVKGLEFDAVIIANAGSQFFTDTVLDRNLLYVAMSRALYGLDILYSGELTPLLK